MQDGVKKIGEILNSNVTRNGAPPPCEGNTLLHRIVICAKCEGRLCPINKVIKAAVEIQRGLEKGARAQIII